MIAENTLCSEQALLDYYKLNKITTYTPCKEYLFKRCKEMDFICVKCNIKRALMIYQFATHEIYARVGEPTYIYQKLDGVIYRRRMDITATLLQVVAEELMHEYPRYRQNIRNMGGY